MEDRIPTPGQEGRVRIIPEDGSAPYYAVIEMADTPTQEGTALNKQNLLQDETCGVLSIPSTSVPNDAFLKLALGIGKYGYAINVFLPNGTPVSGAKITGVQTPDGLQPVTNDDGLAVAVSTEQEITIGIESPYIDIQSVSSKTIHSTGILTKDTTTLQEKTEEYITINTSGLYRYSNLFSSVDIFASGGGGGGGGSYSKQSDDPGGAGGAAGSASNVSGIQIGDRGRSITVTIGAGGKGGYGDNDGTSGGTTTIIDADNGETICSAPGGLGGEKAPATSSNTSNNGDGGLYPTSGGTAQIDAFNDPTVGKVAGGGGGGGYYTDEDNRGVWGGSPYGGRGGLAKSYGGDAMDATGYGGGGGGAGVSGRYDNASNLSGGDGYQGVAMFRFHS